MNIINCIRLNQQEECKMQIVAPLGPLQANSVFPVQKVSAHIWGNGSHMAHIYGQWVSLEKGAKGVGILKNFSEGITFKR